MAAIIVHGGAYAISDDMVPSIIEGCKRAAIVGHKVLESGGSSLDAVEAAVRVLEDDYHFNAGHGAVLNSDGDIEMDAMIMEGKNLQLGSVGGIKGVANPVSLARLVMEKTDHVMLIGEGAKEFARERGIPDVSTEELMSPEMKQKWKNFTKYENVVGKTFNETSFDYTHPSQDIDQTHDHTHPTLDRDIDTDHTHSPQDTVGAVARDVHGNIACATSTGGITLKRPGRIGDSPIIGCGGLADDNLGGVSATGHGESITRVTLAHRVLSLLATHSVDESIDQALRYMWDKTGGKGGLILITKDGVIGKGFTTLHMAWTSIDPSGHIETGIDNPRVNII